MVLSNFAYDGWKMSKSRVNLDLNHILVAGRYFYVSVIIKYSTDKASRASKTTSVFQTKMKSSLIVFTTTTTC